MTRSPLERPRTAGGRYSGENHQNVGHKSNANPFGRHHNVRISNSGHACGVVNDSIGGAKDSSGSGNGSGIGPSRSPIRNSGTTITDGLTPTSAILRSSPNRSAANTNRNSPSAYSRQSPSLRPASLYSPTRSTSPARSHMRSPGLRSSLRSPQGQRYPPARPSTTHMIKQTKRTANATTTDSANSISPATRFSSVCGGSTVLLPVVGEFQAVGWRKITEGSEGSGSGRGNTESSVAPSATQDSTTDNSASETVPNIYKNSTSEKIRVPPLALKSSATNSASALPGEEVEPTRTPPTGQNSNEGDHPSTESDTTMTSPSKPKSPPQPPTQQDLRKFRRIIRLKPKDINFTQKSIRTRFHDGRSIYQLLYELDRQIKAPNDINKIRLVEDQNKSGFYWSLDNRRLFVFKTFCPNEEVECWLYDHPAYRVGGFEKRLHTAKGVELISPREFWTGGKMSLGHLGVRGATGLVGCGGGMGPGGFSTSSPVNSSGNKNYSTTSYTFSKSGVANANTSSTKGPADNDNINDGRDDSDTEWPRIFACIPETPPATPPESECEEEGADDQNENGDKTGNSTDESDINLSSESPTTKRNNSPTPEDYAALRQKYFKCAPHLPSLRSAEHSPKIKKQIEEQKKLETKLIEKEQRFQERGVKSLKELKEVYDTQLRLPQFKIVRKPKPQWHYVRNTNGNANGNGNSNNVTESTPGKEGDDYAGGGIDTGNTDGRGSGNEDNVGGNEDNVGGENGENLKRILIDRDDCGVDESDPADGLIADDRSSSEAAASRSEKAADEIGEVVDLGVGGGKSMKQLWSWLAKSYGYEEETVEKDKNESEIQNANGTVSKVKRIDLVNQSKPKAADAAAAVPKRSPGPSQSPLLCYGFRRDENARQEMVDGKQPAFRGGGGPGIPRAPTMSSEVTPLEVKRGLGVRSTSTSPTRNGGGDCGNSPPPSDNSGSTSSPYAARDRRHQRRLEQLEKQIYSNQISPVRSPNYPSSSNVKSPTQSTNVIVTARPQTANPAGNPAGKTSKQTVSVDGSASPAAKMNQNPQKDKNGGGSKRFSSPKRISKPAAPAEGLAVVGEKQVKIEKQVNGEKQLEKEDCDGGKSKPSPHKKDDKLRERVHLQRLFEQLTNPQFPAPIGQIPSDSVGGKGKEKRSSDKE